MTDATENAAAEAVNDSAQPTDSTGITPADLDFEEQDRPATQEASQEGNADDSVTDEAEEADQESDVTSQPEKAEPEPVKGAAIKLSDDVTIELSDGRKVTGKELSGGFMMQADYTRKTTEIANKSKSLDDTATRVHAIAGAIAEYLQARVPEAPPASLAYTDPATFIQMKAAHDSAMEEVSRFMSAGDHIGNVKKGMTEQQHREVLASENAKLIQMFPETGSDATREKFMAPARDVALRLGFTQQDIDGAMDHRWIAMAHWAAKGMAAENAKAVAQQKVANKPPVTVAKKAVHPNSAKALADVNARKRFEANPTLANAIDLID